MKLTLLQGTKQGWLQKAIHKQEGIDFDETFVPVARLEVIRIFLAYCCTCQLQGLSNGCQKCFLEWRIGGRSLCSAASWI